MQRFFFSFLLSLIICLSVNALPALHLSTNAKEPQEIVSNYQSAENILKQSSAKLVQQALADYALGNYERAIVQWERSLENPEGIDPVTIHTNLGAAYWQVGNLSKAIEHWEQAIQIYRDRKDSDSSHELAAALTDQAQAYNALGQFRFSIERSREASDIAHKVQERHIEVVAQGVLGNAYTTAGDYEKALEAYQASLRLATAVGDRTYITTALNNQTNILNLRAKRYASQASSAQRAGDQEEQLRLTKLANQDKVAALNTATRAVQESKASGGIPEARSLLNMVRLLEQSSSKQNEIADYRKQAAAIIKKQPDSRSKAYTLINLAEAQKELESLKTLKWAITVAKNIGDSRAESFALGAVGEIYELKGELSKAMEQTQQAEFAAQQVNAGDSLYRWQWQAGRIYKASGQPDQATLSYKQAITTLQSIRSDIVTANKELQFDVRDEVEPVYRELMALLLSDSQNKSVNIKEALQVSELLKLNELQGFFGDECLEVAEAISQPEESITKTNEAVINSIVLNQKTYMILRLPDSSINSYAIPITAQQLQSKIERFRLLLVKVGTEEYRSASQELYNLLIRPMEDVLAKFKPSTLVFVNDGVLRNVPMAALHDGRQFLVEKYPIAATLSSVNFISHEKQQQNQPGLVFGLTAKIPPFESLPYVDAETKIVQNILGGSKFLNEDFTLKKLQNEIQEEYPVVHLATHGQFGGTYASTFLQAFDKRISLEELEKVIRNKKEPIELLTLSACQTAAGDNRATLGFAGLAVRTGVENVLATLWAVNDAEVPPLIEEFYTQIRQPGVTKAEALRNAQIKIIANSRLQHPYIWSPFILVEQG